jgi:hypothetical protein
VGHYGADTIYGGSGSDLLVAGSLNFPLNLSLAVYSIQGEWLSGRPLQTRVDNLSGIGNGPKFNDPYYLLPNGTVIDDGAVDRVFGDEDGDWLLVNTAVDQSLDANLLVDIVTNIA